MNQKLSAPAPSEFDALKWRCIGPSRGGRVVAVSGDPVDPMVFYFGACAGGIWKTVDGGVFWRCVSDGFMGSAAVGSIAVAPSDANVIYAGTGETAIRLDVSYGDGLYKSTDAGLTWSHVGLRNSKFIGRICIHPQNPDLVYVAALGDVFGPNSERGVFRSKDGGKSWEKILFRSDVAGAIELTMDRSNPRILFASMWEARRNFWNISSGGPGSGLFRSTDGGANISFNGGASWSTIYNQKTAQFYRLDIDNQYPYRVYGTQQDNTSIAVPSASEWGVITLADCSYPGTGESGFIAVNPKDHNIVYVGAVGSSPGGAGALQRYDHRTRQIQLVNVWPEESTGIAPKDLKYRFAWTFPIVFSAHDASTLYVGGNCVFRTRDEGMSWQKISPDLSLNDLARQGPSGGDITRESAGAEVHATCACVVESPHRQGEIWASTDDGLVHVTRDDGGTWKNVTPRGVPELAYVGCVEVSAHDADTIYLAATRYKLADYKPYLFRSSDGGRTWKSIKGNLPTTEITRVVRADPVAKGLLYVGTETGIFFSLDDGESWTRMGGGLPVVPVYDLKLKDTDLVAATHGRSFWILDDVTALRGLANGHRSTRLFGPRTAIRTKLHWSAGANVRNGIAYGPAFGIDGSTVMVDRPDGTRMREHLDVGENPPSGAIVYYWLAEDARVPVTLTFRDAAGRRIVSYASDAKDVPPARRPGTKAGLNRYVWDMKYPGPTKLDYDLAPPRPKPLAPDPENPPGPTVVPGAYGVDLLIGDKVQSATFTVDKDPRLGTTTADYAAQFALHRELVASLSKLKQALNRLRRMKRQLGDVAERAAKSQRALRNRAVAIGNKLSAIERIMVDPERKSVRDVLRNPAGLNDTLFDMIAMTTTADAAPTSQTKAVSREVMDKVDGEIGKFEALVNGEIADLNAKLAKARVAQVAAT